MGDGGDLKEKAARASAQGRLERAAELYRDHLARHAGDVGARRQLADVLRRAGDRAAAVAEYREVVEAHARAGFLLRAIAVGKVILELDPGHVEAQAQLAELFARKDGGPRPAAAGAPAGPPAPEPAPPPEAATDPVAAVAAPTHFEAIQAAAAEARRAGGDDPELELELEVTVEPPEGPVPLAGPEGVRALPRVPIFADLTPAAFRALAGRVRARRVQAGEVVLRQGERGDGFYAVVDGRFCVERATPAGEVLPLGELTAGAFFGEMALLSGEPRAASVRAAEPGELLEIAADTLRALCREHPQVADAVGRFYAERVLANALATSPIFRPFAPGERAALARRFTCCRAAAGQEVVAEGRPSDGLYVVLSGLLAVLRGPEQREAAALREGDVFGEMSCLARGPATATVVARRAATLLRLPRAAFDEIILTHPPVLELVAELAEERRRGLAATASAPLMV